jgi:hypothetical protein
MPSPYSNTLAVALLDVIQRYSEVFRRIPDPNHVVFGSDSHWTTGKRRKYLNQTIERMRKERRLNQKKCRDELYRELVNIARTKLPREKIHIFVDGLNRNLRRAYGNREYLPGKMLYINAVLENLREFLWLHYPMDCQNMLDTALAEAVTKAPTGDEYWSKIVKQIITLGANPLILQKYFTNGTKVENSKYQIILETCEKTGAVILPYIQGEDKAEKIYALLYAHMCHQSYDPEHHILRLLATDLACAYIDAGADILNPKYCDEIAIMAANLGMETVFLHAINKIPDPLKKQKVAASAMIAAAYNCHYEIIEWGVSYFGVHPLTAVPFDSDAKIMKQAVISDDPFIKSDLSIYEVIMSLAKGFAARRPDRTENLKIIEAIFLSTAGVREYSLAKIHAEKGLTSISQLGGEVEKEAFGRYAFDVLNPLGEDEPDYPALEGYAGPLSELDIP